MDEDHLRASEWFEANGLEIEAFQHAAAGHDVERAERLIEGRGMPLHFRGALVPILHWLDSLPTTVLDARPSLWVTYAQVVAQLGPEHRRRVEAPGRRTSAAGRQDRTPDPGPRWTDRHRAGLPGAGARNQVETIIAQSRRALEYLDPDNLPFRTAAALTLGHAYVLLGDRCRGAASPCGGVGISAASGNTIYEILGSIGLGYIQELDNQLVLAAETFGAPSSWQPVCRFPSSAKPTWAWPACTTSGTTSMPPNGTGSRVSSWHDR